MHSVRLPTIAPMPLFKSYVGVANIAQLPQRPMHSVRLPTIAPTPLFKSYVGVASTVQLPQRPMHSVWLATIAPTPPFRSRHLLVSTLELVLHQQQHASPALPMPPLRSALLAPLRTCPAAPSAMLATTAMVEPAHFAPPTSGALLASITAVLSKPTVLPILPARTSASAMLVLWVMVLWPPPLHAPTVGQASTALVATAIPPIPALQIRHHHLGPPPFYNACAGLAFSGIMAPTARCARLTHIVLVAYYRIALQTANLQLALLS